jgi:hypothetical protein
MTLEVREFPLETQIGRFDNEQEVDEWLLTNDDPHQYAAVIKASQCIYSRQIEEYLIRYKMQKSYNIYSYSQNFDEIPADWIDMLAFIDGCINEAQQEKNRLGR